MSVISSDKLHNLLVETELGSHIGHVKNWDIDIETHEIVRYYVKASGLIQMLTNESLIITPAQVVRIEKDKMIVDDAVEKAHKALSKNRNIVPDSASPAMTRDL